MPRSIPFLVTSLFVLVPPLASCAQDLSGLFEQMKPTVVVVEAEKGVSMPTHEGENYVDQSGLGSGVLIEKRRILTATHVVHTADAIIVHLYDGQEIPAKVRAFSPTTDVALLELAYTPKKVNFAKVGDSDKTKIGEPVFVIGAPYGLTYTLTVWRNGERIDLEHKPCARIRALLGIAGSLSNTPNQYIIEIILFYEEFPVCKINLSYSPSCSSS